MFFDSWSGLGRVVAVGILAYVAVILLLRITGNRTLSKLNAFDLVVTVALGSTLATILLNKSVALVEGIVAVALLVGLQFAVTWCSVRWPFFSKLVKSEPVLLVLRGRLLSAPMRRARVVENEVLAVVRQRGFGGLEDVHAVVLESDGSLSVVSANKVRSHEATALRNVEFPADGEPRSRSERGGDDRSHRPAAGPSGRQDGRR